MEEEEKQEQKPATEERVFFDQPTLDRDEGGKRGTFIALAIILVLLAAVGGWFFFLRGTQESALPSPTPVSEVTIPSEVSTPTPAPFDKTQVRIEVLNGTGIAGEAGFLKDRLVALGYSNVKVGNAAKQDYTQTEVAFAGGLEDQAREEIEAKLGEIYDGVKTSSLAQNQLDVRIITGLRKGATPRPTPTPTPTSTATPTATPTASPSPSPTP